MVPVILRALAAGSKLPAIYHNRDFLDVGGLMSYGARRTAQYIRAASYVDKILRGSNPRDLPIERMSEFEFVVNANTGRALGLVLPVDVASQVTEWYE